MSGGDFGETIQLPIGRQQYICIDWTAYIERNRLIRNIFKNGLTPDYIDCLFKYCGAVEVKLHSVRGSEVTIALLIIFLRWPNSSRNTKTHFWGWGEEGASPF